MATVEKLKNHTISGTKDADTIQNSDSNVIILGKTGDDSIYNLGSNVSIDAGAGDDTINNDCSIRYDYDPITDEDEIVESISADNVTINAGTGNDSIKNYGMNVSISGGAGDDSIINYGNNVTIDGGNGNNYIRNGNNHVQINMGAGNNFIFNYGDDVTIDAGMGNNSIYSSGDNVSVIVNGYSNTVLGVATVNMGTDNTTLTGDGYEQTYQYSGGSCTITNYSGEDTLGIAAGKIDSYSFDRGDLIFHIGNGSITLKDMINHYVTVKDSSGETKQLYGTGYSPQEVIKNFVKSMSNTALTSNLVLDEAVKACSGFNSMQEVIDSMVADCRKANDAEIFLREYCGIFSDNKDNGAAIGWDVGGSKVKEGADLYTSTNEAFYPESTTVTIHSDNGGYLIVNVPDKNSLNEQEQLMVKGFCSWWAKDAINLVEASYGVKFSGQKISLGFMNDPTAYGSAYGDASSIIINTAGKRATERNLRNFLSATIAHEMTHVMQGIFGIMPYAKSYMTEGMAELTKGRNRYDFADNPDKLAEYLALDGNTSSANYDYTYSVGYMFWCYLMKQAAKSYDSSKGYAWKDGSKIIGTSDSELLTGNGNAQTLAAGKGNDTITAYGNNTKILGEAGDDTIYSNGTNNTIFGNAGDDVILIGNSASDNFIVYRAGDGNDLIEGFNDTSTLSIAGGSYSTVASGNDIIVTVGEDKITMRGAASLNKPNINKILTVTDGDGINVKLSDDYISADASKRTKSISITGNALDNSLLGGAGNDSINGGKGNDTLTGSWGADTFVYTGGQDIITDYTAGDKISLAGDGAKYLSHITGVDVDGSNVKLTFSKDSSKTLTLNGTAGKKVIVNDISLIFNDNAILTANKEFATLMSGYSGKFNANGYSKVDASAAIQPVAISGGNKNGVSIVGGAKADSIVGTVGNDTLTGSWGADIFVYTGGKDVITDYTAGDKISLAGDGAKYLSHITGVDVDGSNVKLTFSKDSRKTLTLNGAAGKQVVLNDATRYLTDKQIISYDKKTVTLTSAFGGKFNANGYSKVDASAVIQPVAISGGNKNGVSIVGGAKADSIVGTVGNDTLTGSWGTDTFVYTGGKDVITDYTAGDKISLGAAVTKSTFSGSDVMLITAKGSLTIKNAKDKTLKLIDSAGKELSTIIGGYKTVTLYDEGSNKVNLPSTYIAADASKRTKPIIIVGNSLDNSIVGGKSNDLLNGGNGADSINGGLGNDKILGGNDNDTIIGNAGDDYLDGSDGADKLYGGSGDDTLIGGKGNDSLWGNDGADKFIYNNGDGNDVIYGFNDTDMLEISGDWTAAYYKASGRVVFKVGDTYSAIILEKSDATTFNVNGDSYQISNNKFVKK